MSIDTKKAVADLVIRANSELDALRAELAAKDARIAELEANPNRRCCKGCPDCLGIGVHYELDWRQERIAELEARIAELTEWRPMATAPEGFFFVLVESADFHVRIARNFGFGVNNQNGEPFALGVRLVGWKPFPEVPHD